MNGENGSYESNGYKISYDTSQLIQIENSQYENTNSYFEIEIKDKSDKWTVLGSMTNYPIEFDEIIEDKGIIQNILSIYESITN